MTNRSPSRTRRRSRGRCAFASDALIFGMRQISSSGPTDLYHFQANRISVQFVPHRRVVAYRTVRASPLKEPCRRPARFPNLGTRPRASELAIAIWPYSSQDGKLAMAKPRMCPHCRAFVDSSDKTCPYCENDLPMTAGRRLLREERIRNAGAQVSFTTKLLLLVNASLFVVSLGADCPLHRRDELSRRD